MDRAKGTTDLNDRLNRCTLRPWNSATRPHRSRSRPRPDQYRHWKLSIRRPRGDAGHGRAGRRRSAPERLQAETQLLRSRRRHRARRRAAAPPLRASRSPRRGADSSLKPRIFCAGANIFMLGTSGHGFKVNFCKFTNETRLGMEDMSAQQRHQVPRRAQRHLRRRRLRAGAGLRRDLPGRRWQRVGVAAGNAAAGRAARHRRADARRRQAQGPARRRRSLQHAGRRRARQARRRLAVRGQGVPDQPVQGSGRERGRASWRRCRIGRSSGPGIALGPLKPSDRTGRHPLPVRHGGDRPRQAHVRPDDRRARYAAAARRRTSSSRRAISRGPCAPSASSTTACCACG